jgi:hypothetical protein
VRRNTTKYGRPIFNEIIDKEVPAPVTYEADSQFMSKTPKGKPGLLQAQGYHFNSYNPELNKTMPAEVGLAKFNN